MASKLPVPGGVGRAPATGHPLSSEEQAFAEIVEMIQGARGRVLAAVNTALIDLYWQIGEYLSRRIDEDGWGKGTVAALAAYIQKGQPGVSGFSPQNLWRMRQLFDTYRDQPILSPLVRELPWSHNLLILNRCKRTEEREFYLRLVLRERWSRRDLERQLASALFERVVLSPPKASAALKEEIKARQPGIEPVFQDAYLVEFLDLADGHREADLHRSLLHNLQRFLAELGRDFCFIGSEVILQVGGKDFALDLLFFHRGLCSLVAIELKVDEFQPEYLGKLEFYLEALDRDVRKPHEGPSIGMLLCASKNNEVVEYALSRSASPALVAEYQTQMPDKKLLQAKLHEFLLTERAQEE